MTRRKFLTGMVTTSVTMPILSAPFVIGKAFAQKIAIPSFKIQFITAGLRNPWAMCADDNGGFFITEKAGRLRYLNNKNQLSPPIIGLPDILPIGQGGLLDVQLSPDFNYTGQLYITFTIQDGNDSGQRLSRLAIARLFWNGHAIEKYDIIFTTNTAHIGGRHFGGRIRFLPDKTLLVTTGDRAHKDLPQQLDNHWGKILRITKTGGVPSDNPFVGRDGVLPEIYSYGHRNPQGLALHPKDNSIWASEHGPQGGDELNLIQQRANYGWSIITKGIGYDGSVIGQGDADIAGLQQPIVDWTPSIAPSGASFYQGQEFAEINHQLLIGALKFKQILVVYLDDDNTLNRQEIMLDGDLGRIRDVYCHDDEFIYVLNDEFDAGLFRLVPNR